MTSSVKKIAFNAKISTHTPAWGVTAFWITTATDNFISTHTPAWGVTPETGMGKDGRRHFNSHARVGRDVCITNRCQCSDISTHTPAWGVTYRLK